MVETDPTPVLTLDKLTKKLGFLVVSLSNKVPTAKTTLAILVTVTSKNSVSVAVR